MKILAIGAHFDDVELGCGGSLLKWKQQGHGITVFTATVSGYRDPEGKQIRDENQAAVEGRESARLMGADLIEGTFPTFQVEFNESLNSTLVDLFARIQPDILLTHWSQDTHHDHRQLALATLHCARRVPRVLMYESNWYAGEGSFDARYFVDITDTYPGKLELLRTFKSEHARAGESWERFAAAKSEYFGLQAGVSRAEGFQVVRWLE